MTIESDFKAMNIHLGRIADALEAKNEQQGVVAEASAEVKPAAKKAAKKTTSEKDNKTQVGKPKEDPIDDGLELKDVRAALKKLQAAESQGHVKSLLKRHGASTLGQLEQAKYSIVISEALETAGE